MTVSMQDTLSRARKHMMPCYNPQPLVMDHGLGAEVWDTEGTRYLDLIGGLAVVGLGHCHPKVVEAVQRQASKLFHCSNLYGHENVAELAARLCANSFAERVFLCNSGAEANEAALKLARRHASLKGTGRFEFITAQNSFHGRTMATVTATGQEKYRAGFEPLIPGFRYVPFGDVEAMARALGPRTAAVLLEPIQGEGGMIVPPPGYLKQVAEMCKGAGCLLMLDEIQSGMGRTGTMFAYQQEGITPDVITVAKGLGNGLPIGAMLTTHELGQALGPAMHASTFGGNPVACAAAMAVMDVLTADGFLAGVRDRSATLRRHLTELAARHSSVLGEVRGRGMWLGCELKRDGTALLSVAREHGVLINIIHGHVLRLAPPLIISDGQMEEAFTRLDQAVKAFTTQPPAPGAAA